MIKGMDIGPHHLQEVPVSYPDKQIHIKSDKAFEDGFYCNMSGIELMVPVPDGHRYIISGIRKRSKAGLAGIRPGDEVLPINGSLPSG